MHYNSHSPAFSSIIIYIIIILIISIIKPTFIYDHDNKKFREFGFAENQSPLTLLTFGIILSFITYNFISLISPQYSSKYLKYRNYH